MSQLELFLFGPPRLEFGGKPVDLKLRKAMAILVYLAITKRRSSRDELATMLWPESSQSSARASLRRTLYACNKNIGVEILLADTEAISLDPQVDLRIDVESFKQCMRECSPDGEQMRALNSHCLPVLEKAVALYTGDFLAGFSLPDSPVFDEWQFFESESLRSLLSTALQQLVFTYENQGKSPQAIEHARRWLSLDPLHEPAHQQLMKLYAQSGQQAAALRQYQECERILDQELGVPPQPETTACYQSIRLHRQTAPQPQVISQSEIKYVASGHVTIAYQVFGDGPLDIVWVSGFITHMEQLWKLQSLASFFTGLAEFSRVIMFDRRGVGLSDRVGYPPTLEDTMEDMQVVLQAVGSTHAVLFGYLEGGPNSMLFAATYPEHVSGLVLYGTAAKWARSENYPWALTHEQYDRWLHYISENWGEALNLDTYAPSYAHEPLYQEWFAKTLRLGSSPGGVKAVLEVMRDIDVRHVLPTIRIPTLILHRKGDRAIRVGAGRYLASQIPGAKYVELEGQDHWFFVGDSQSVLNEIRRFVQDLGSPPIPERMLATILIIEVMEDWMEPSAPSHTTD
ncbi:MAG: alpha/beta fold hydrolase, partial [Anaerolineales bacterium]